MALSLNYNGFTIACKPSRKTFLFFEYLGIKQLLI
jgi:hypothetical protein